jgi:hypothetical protein
MLVVAMQKDSFAVDALSHLNDIETEIVTYIERQFLKIRGWLYGALLERDTTKGRYDSFSRCFVFA